MAIGDRIRAFREARAQGETPIRDALGLGQQQAPQQVAVNRSQGGGGGSGGTRGDPQVFALQQQLAAAGFNPGPIDGIMGPQTRAAMQARDAAANPVPLPRPRPEQPVPMPRPRPEQANSGMGSYNAQAPMDYRAQVGMAPNNQFSAPAPGSLTTGQLTPVDYRPPGWLPVPQPGPVPTTQEWTTRGRGGSIGAPDGDPSLAAVYDQGGLTGGQRTQYAAEQGMRTEPAPPPPTFDQRFAPLALPPAPTFDERFAPLALPQQAPPYVPTDLAQMRALAGTLGTPPAPNLTPREMARLGQLLRVRRDDTATMPREFIPTLGNLTAPGV